jgi:thiol-disulfide isomerase/thioredoxin/YHS domain-containing protein
MADNMYLRARLGKMQSKYWICFIVAVAILLPSGADAQQSSVWQPTLENARRVAAQTDRLVLMYFCADWCQPCHEMEQDVFTQPNLVAELQKNYVPVKINADNFPATCKLYSVTGLPTTVITTPGGILVESMRGRMEPGQYVSRVGQIAMVEKQKQNGAVAQGPMVLNPTQSSLPPQSQPAPNASPMMTASIPGSLSTVPPSQQMAPVAPQITPAAQTMAPLAQQTTPSAQQMARSAAPQQTVYAPAPPQMSPAASQMAQASPPKTAAASPTAQTSPVVPQSQWHPETWFSGLPQGAQSRPSTMSASQPPASEPVVSQPVQNPPVALDGFCPVRLVEGRQWVYGDRRWGVIHRGRTYLFSGPDEQARFFADPDRYAPVLSGNDVVLAVERGQLVAGMREYGVFFADKIYLFADRATLEKFEKDPNQYVDAIQQIARANSLPGRQIR